jgi:hypothetical protein
MDCWSYRGSIGLGAESGLRPDGCSKRVHNAVRPLGYPKPSVLTVSDSLPFLLAWRMEQGRPSEEREEPMSEGSASEDEQRKVDDEGAIGGRTDFDPEEPIGEVDDETLSEVVRRPTRTAGDLSEAADTSPGITTEDLARDLEAVASKRGVPTDSELLADLLRRVQRIEAHLGIASTDFDDE